jgi:hypothetical protein
MAKDAQIPEIRAAVVCPACAFPAPVPAGSSVAVCACGAVIRVPTIPTWPPMARTSSDEILTTRPEVRER